MVGSNKKHFCIRPFNSGRIGPRGEIDICCAIDSSKTKFKGYKPFNIKNTDIQTWWNSDYLKYVRQSFLENKKLHECSQCWRYEESGLKSDRTRANKDHKAIFQNKYETNLKRIGKYDLQHPEFMELQITNLCNLKCQMCNGQESSRLLVENNALGFENLNQKDYDLNEDHYKKIKDIVKHDLRMLSLLGGEPLFNKKVLHLLSLLVENGKAEKIKLHITTNGTICDDKILQMLKKFKDIRLMLSMEGIDKCNEYMRFPSDWNKIKDNISKFKTLDNTYIYINSVVQNLNILYIDKLIDFSHYNDFYISFNPIIRPEYLNMLNLPKAILQEAYTKLSNIPEEKLIHSENVKSIISILDKHLNGGMINDNNYQEFVSMIKKRDNYRKVHIKDYMPELAEAIYR